MDAIGASNEKHRDTHDEGSGSLMVLPTPQS